MHTNMLRVHVPLVLFFIPAVHHCRVTFHGQIHSLCINIQTTPLGSNQETDGKESRVAKVDFVKRVLLTFKDLEYTSYMY